MSRPTWYAAQNAAVSASSESIGATSTSSTSTESTGHVSRAATTADANRSGRVRAGTVDSVPVHASFDMPAILARTAGESPAVRARTAVGNGQVARKKMSAAITTAQTAIATTAMTVLLRLES